MSPATYIWPCGLHQASKPCPLPQCPICEQVLHELRQQRGLGRILDLLEKRRQHGRTIGQAQSAKARQKEKPALRRTKGTT